MPAATHAGQRNRLHKLSLPAELAQAHGRNGFGRRPAGMPERRGTSHCERGLCGLINRGYIAGKCRAANVSHLVAVEATGAMYRGAVVPDYQVMHLPFMRVDEFALCRMFGQVAQVPPAFAPSRNSGDWLLLP